MTAGPLALVGGDEWVDGCSFDQALLSESGADTVVVLPTAAAYEAPSQRVDLARSWFEGLGVAMQALPVYGRTDALDADHVAAVRAARFIYIGSGSQMHLRSVLKDTPLLDAMVEAWRGGAVLAGAEAGGAVLFDHMVDTRGGAFTVGLGVVSGFAMIPRVDTWSSDKVHRTVDLAARGLPVAGIEERTALIYRQGSGWTVEGAGAVKVFLDGATADLDALPSIG